MYGIVEDNLVIDEGEFTGDTDKVCGILNYLEIDTYSIINSFRLGMEGDRPHPINITFSSRDTATHILEKTQN